MSAAAWQPQEAGLVQLCNLLAASQRGEDQQQILLQLDQYKLYPDFNNYLAFIFGKADHIPVEVRQSAGLYLKNSLKQQYAATGDEFKAYIKESLIPLLAHPQRVLRQTVGTNIAAIVKAGSLEAWPELAGLLVQCMSSSDHAAIDGALDTLFKIVEEVASQIDATVSNPAGGLIKASSLLVPVLLTLMQSEGPDVKKQATAVLNMMAREMPAGIHDNLDTYVLSLFGLAHDPAASVRVEVVRGMVQLLTVQPDKLHAHLYQVIEYMLQSNEAADEGIALESCEFWMAFCEAQLEPELLRPFLPRLIPMLMKNMVFHEDDEEVLDAIEAEQAKPERASEMRPVHHKQSQQHGGADDDDGDDGDDEGYARWNLRKCSAAGLDRLAVVYGDELLPVLMPIVEARLQEQDWRARESAILALGAVAEGCHMGLMPYLGSMTLMLVPKLADPQPMVRIITCWSLTRYSFWLLAGAQEAAAVIAGQRPPQSVPGKPPPSDMGPIVQGLLCCILDRNRLVQEAACSSMATLCEVAGQEQAAPVLRPYLQAIVEALCIAVTQCGRRNLRNACDALSMLGEAVGSDLQDPTLSNLLLTTLCNRLAGIGPQDRDLIPVMESLNTAAATVGSALDAWAPRIMEMGMAVITTQSALRAAHQAGAPVTPRGPEYDSDIHVAALDMMSGLAEGLGPSMDPLIQGSQLVPAVLAACRDELADLRQSGFALVGDLSSGCVSHLVPVVGEVVAAAMVALSPQMISQPNMRSCNNACWSTGELAVRLQPEVVLVWAAAVAERMAGLLVMGPNSLPRSLIENAAITLGRVSWRAPDQLAPHLSLFCTAWCQALRNVKDGMEKEHAFHGLCALLTRQPGPGAFTPGPSFGALAGAMVSWRTLRSPVLQQEIKQALAGVQAQMLAAGTWQQALAVLEPAVQAKLCSMML